MKCLYKRKMMMAVLALCLMMTGAGMIALNKLISVKAQKTVMTINNVNDMTITMDAQPDYLRGISVTGGKGRVQLAVNTSHIDLQKAGTYPIIYTAKDHLGQVIMKKAKVKVLSPNNRKVVYLTFDDGPSVNTPKILRILKKYRVKATFFVTGQEPVYFRYIRQADQQGCCIGAHSYTHQFSIYQSEAVYFNDLARIEKLIRCYTGHTSQLVRFPGGSSNTISRHYAHGIMSVLANDLLKRGYQYVDWNMDSTDASGNNVPVSQLVKNATSGYSLHRCVLMHDAGAKKTTVQALPKIIQYYQQHDYAFDTLNHSPYVFHHHINN